ncbi:MAG: S8 family serine peptidase [Limnobacter sp.]|nr:S8 family serine peptidase [Limnobacter sp.]
MNTRQVKNTLCEQGIRHLGLMFLSIWLCVFASQALAQNATSDRFVLKLHDSVELSSSPSVRRLEAEGDRIREVLDRNGVEATWLRAGSLGSHVLQWAPSVRPTDRQALINRLSSDPDVQYVFEDEIVQPMVAPNDSRFTDQWAIRAASSVASSRFDQAWETTRGSADVVVAVVDTGVVYETSELAGRLLAGYDFISNLETANDGDGRDADASDPGDWVESSDLSSSTFNGCSVEDSSWHGTFISAQIAANTNNGTRVAGADWNTKILPIRVSGKCRAYSSDLFDGMLWSAGVAVPNVPANPNPADVINVSLGADTACNSFHQDVMNRINATGAVIVAAAGNGGGSPFLPANCSGVLAVGALDIDGSRAQYSAIGSGVDFAAPGGFTQGILGVGNSGTKSPGTSQLVVNTGTSFSAPFAAAAAALVKQVNSGLSSAQIRDILRNTTSSFVSPNGSQCAPGDGKRTCDCNTSTCGTGMLNAEAAVAQARTSIPVANGAASINGSTLTLNGSLSKVSAGRTVASYEWRQIAGTTVMTSPSSQPDITLVAPATTSDLVFQLTVTDSVGEKHVTLAAQRSGSGTGETTMPTASSSNSSAPSGDSSSNVSQPAAEGGGGGGGGSMALAGLLALWMLLVMARREPVKPNRQ